MIGLGVFFENTGAMADMVSLGAHVRRSYPGGMWEVKEGRVIKAQLTPAPREEWSVVYRRMTVLF